MDNTVEEAGATTMILIISGTKNLKLLVVIVLEMIGVEWFRLETSFGCVKD